MVGCCGWGYFRPKLRYGTGWKRRFSSTLAAYASVFSLVEVNSTFYRMPRIDTAERWLRDARGVNKEFQFTVKCNRVVTHEDRFSSKESLRVFGYMMKVCKALKAKVMLIQTPASFQPDEENVGSMKKFMKNAMRMVKGKVRIAWEPRGRWWDDEEKIRGMCEEFGLINCVDPMRNEPVVAGDVTYFRLHGFGKPMMYNYRFSKDELKRIKSLAKRFGGRRETYLLFNNTFMYENAEEFMKMGVG